MFVRQLYINAQIRHTKDGLGVRIYNVRKCGLYKSSLSESQGPPVLINQMALEKYLYKQNI